MPELTTLHVGKSFARPWNPRDADPEIDSYEHPVTTDGLDWFIRKLPNLEQLSLFCLHRPTQLISLTALTNLCATVSMNRLYIPHYTDLFTFARQGPHESARLASVTLPPCLKSLNFLVACPRWDAIFPSASPLTGLEELLLTDCSGLESLPDGIDVLLPCLRKLSIRKCQSLSHLPESLTCLSQLETLIISSSHRFTLPTNLGRLPALKLLVLEHLSVSELPPFCHLTSLEALFLLDCYSFGGLPEGFCRLTALRVLCFASAGGLALPEDVGALARLEDLRLCDCQPQPLPTSFADLSSLTSLELNACGFEAELPDALGDLSSLRELKIIDVLVTTLPRSLTKLTALQTLEVRHCQTLLAVPVGLDNLVRLKWLGLRECRQLIQLPTRLPPSLETLCLGPAWEGSSHVVDILQLSQLRVLKLKCVGVQCSPAMSRMLTCLQQMKQQVEQLEQQGGGPEIPLPLSSLSRLRSLFSEQLELLQPPEQLEQATQLQQLEQLEMRLEGDNRELQVPLTCLPRLRSLLIEAPGILSLPENMAAALPQLRQLELLSWLPEELPGVLLELRSLTSLAIEAPQLVALPQDLSRLSRLRKLELIRCTALQHLPEFVSQLHHLTLRDTSIPYHHANLVRGVQAP
ncbi:unnamed protein product [Closterium sp. NIES-65]|nr:unnamed protein product [Closterium sp. NIES-65]